MAMADTELRAFWAQLPLEGRTKLMNVHRKPLFEEIRRRYCSRCFGLFVLRYDELCGAACGVATGGAACEACPRCQQLFLGLVADAKTVRLEDSLVAEGPFTSFSDAEHRERERDIQFLAAGDVCGSGFNPRKHGKVCQLHTSLVGSETLVTYWEQLPQEHRDMLFSLPRHDFEAELDSCCTLQLQVCRDCRYNVTQQYKLALAAGRKECRAACMQQSCTAKAGISPPGDECNMAVHGCCDEHCGGSHGETVEGNEVANASSGPAVSGCMVPLKGCLLRITEDMVFLDCDDTAALFNQAEEIEEAKTSGDDGDIHGDVRHAETPALAQRVLLDAAILIFKAQVEVAFKEQTAGHNALLLLTHLALSLMKGQLQAAALDVRARQAQAELLQQLDEAEERTQASKHRKKAKKKAKAKGGNGALARSDTSSLAPPSLGPASDCQSEDGSPVNAADPPLSPQQPADCDTPPMLAVRDILKGRTQLEKGGGQEIAEETALHESLAEELSGVSLEEQRAWEHTVMGESACQEWEVQQRGGRKGANRKPAASVAVPRAPPVHRETTLLAHRRPRVPMEPAVPVIAPPHVPLEMPVSGKWAAVVAGAVHPPQPMPQPPLPQHHAPSVVAMLPPPTLPPSKALQALQQASSGGGMSSAREGYVPPPPPPRLLQPSLSAWHRQDSKVLPVLEQHAQHVVQPQQQPQQQQQQQQQQLMNGGCATYSLWGSNSEQCGASIPLSSSRDSLATYSDSVSLYGSPPVAARRFSTSSSTRTSLESRAGMHQRGQQGGIQKQPVSPLLDACQGGMWSNFSGARSPAYVSMFSGESLQLPGSCTDEHSVWGNYVGSSGNARGGHGGGSFGCGGAAQTVQQSIGAKFISPWDSAQPCSRFQPSPALPTYQLFGVQHDMVNASKIAW